ncbi:MAG: BrnT family toxin [Deltaproteobacteria bacterium]|nr:BrnT family toxin [Deltaproteobacteria bacterium]
MYIDDFVWLPGILDKLAVKHHVTQDEVEEVFFNWPWFRFVESGHRAGEDVYAASGQTDAGRYLSVFFIRKSGNRALILSARDMDEKERRRYERK